MTTDEGVDGEVEWSEGEGEEAGRELRECIEESVERERLGAGLTPPLIECTLHTSSVRESTTTYRREA